MSELSIRCALPDDEEELARLDRAAWSPLHAVTPRQQPPYRPFFGEHHSPDDCLVAEADRRILGYVLLGFPTRSKRTPTFARSRALSSPRRPVAAVSAGR